MKIPMSLLRTAGYCCGVLLLASQLAGCGGGGSAAQAKETKADAVTAVPVEVASVSRGQITASYSGTATLTPDRDAQVAAKTSGVLKKLYVEEGMSVKEGQLLAELEDATQRSQLAQAEAQMRKSDATFAYAQQSIAKQLIPKRDFDQAKFDMENLRAAYESARLQLAYTRILAPIGGVIAERSVKLGNLIQTNQSMFRIVGMNSLQTVLNVPERQLGILKPGQPVELEADALPGKKFSGNILRIAPVVDAASGTFRVTCEFHDKTSELKPGMFGRVDIIYDQRADALTIPRSALIEEDGETAVFAVDKATQKAADSKAKTGNADADAKKTDTVKSATAELVAHRKLVKIGYSDGDKVEIRSGLDEGTRVITIGRNAVRDGTVVQVLNGDKDKVLAAKAVAGAKG